MTQATTLCQLRNKRVSHVNYDVGLPQWLPRQCFFKIQLPCLKSKTCSQNRWATAYLCIASIASHTHKNVTLGLQGFGKIFSTGRDSGFFKELPKIFFQGRPKVVKWHFAHSKLRKQPFSAKHLLGKFEISKSRGTLAPLSDTLEKIFPPFWHPWLHHSKYVTLNSFKDR